MWVSRVLGDDHYTRMARVTVCVDPYCSWAISAEHRSKFAALHRQCWRLQMNETFSSGTEHSKKNPPNPPNLWFPLVKIWFVSKNYGTLIFSGYLWKTWKTMVLYNTLTIKKYGKQWNTRNHETITKTKELWFVLEKTIILYQNLWNYCKLQYTKVLSWLG